MTKNSVVSVVMWGREVPVRVGRQEWDTDDEARAEIAELVAANEWYGAADENLYSIGHEYRRLPWWETRDGVTRVAGTLAMAAK